MKKENSFCFSNAIEKVVKEREPLRQLFKSQRRTRQEERDSTGSKISAFNFFFFSCHANQGKGRHSFHIRLDRGLPLKDYASIFILFSSFTFWENDPLHFWGLRINPVQKSHRRNWNSNINKNRKSQAFTSKALNVGTNIKKNDWQVIFLFSQSTEHVFIWQSLGSIASLNKSRNPIGLIAIKFS